jgi:hypothetical protein
VKNHRSSRALSLAATLALLSALAMAMASASAFAPTAAHASAQRQQRPLGARARGSDLVTTRGPASATLEQCETTGSQEQRSATFAGEMTAVAGTERMQMSVQVLERTPGESAYRVIDAPGLGMWRSSAPGVQSFKYLHQVSNLAAPAFYRASIRFRWLGDHGKTLMALELQTHRCEQPAEADAPADAPASASEGAAPS